ncbi:MAG: RluA family pseudouridine synthase [Opitutaceae bacterium]|nr:RluA family pseudouridine synthase [Opitutaceae bacterium]
MRAIRADKALAVGVSGHSRSALQRAFDAGLVSRDGVTLTRDATVRGGDVIAFSMPQTKPSELKPVKIPLDVLYEDKHLLVLNKAAGMVVHPGAATGADTLVHALLAHCKGSLSGIGGVERPGIVHRLDRETSGVIVVAKTDAAHRGLAEQFSARTLRKEYLALVSGAPSLLSGSITKPIGRHPTQRHKMMAFDDAPEPDVTGERVVERVGKREEKHVEKRVEKRAGKRVGKHVAGTVFAADDDGDGDDGGGGGGDSGSDGSGGFYDLEAEAGEAAGGESADGESANGGSEAGEAGEAAGGARRKRPGGGGARDAHTDWEVVERYGKIAALVRCMIHTGRTHQIRVHMKSIGHILMGDVVYGWKPDARVPEKSQPKRVMLHAEHLVVRHPITGRTLDLRAPAPKDFSAMMRALKTAARTRKGDL